MSSTTQVITITLYSPTCSCECNHLDCVFFVSIIRYCCTPIPRNPLKITNIHPPRITKRHAHAHYFRYSQSHSHNVCVCECECDLSAALYCINNQSVTHPQFSSTLTQTNRRFIVSEKPDRIPNNIQPECVVQRHYTTWLHIL